jgi:hypothetical protein
MAQQTVILPRERALDVQNALEIASEIVVALEWITSQNGASTGALQAVKCCVLRLDRALGDTYEFMHQALMDAKPGDAHSGFDEEEAARGAPDDRPALVLVQAPLPAVMSAPPSGR